MSLILIRTGWKLKHTAGAVFLGRAAHPYSRRGAAGAVRRAGEPPGEAGRGAEDRGFFFPTAELRVLI